MILHQLTSLGQGRCSCPPKGQDEVYQMLQKVEIRRDLARERQETEVRPIVVIVKEEKSWWDRLVNWIRGMI